MCDELLTDTFKHESEELTSLTNVLYLRTVTHLLLYQEHLVCETLLPDPSSVSSFSFFIGHDLILNQALKDGVRW